MLASDFMGGTPQNPELFGVPFQVAPLKKYENIKVAFPDQPTELTFLYVAHEEESDVPEDLPDLLDATDTLLLEGLRWTEDALRAHNGFSQGETTDKDFYSYNGYHRKLIADLMGSETPVRFCDLPNSKKLQKALEENEKPLDLMGTTGPQHTIARQKKASQNWMRTIWMPRERHMISTAHELTVEPHVAVSDNDQVIRGLFMVGAGHYTVAEALESKIAAAGLSNKHVIKEVLATDALNSDKYKTLLYRQLAQGDALSDTFVGKMLLQGIIRDRGQFNSEQKTVGYQAIDALTNEELFDYMTQILGDPTQRALGIMSLVGLQQ